MKTVRKKTRWVLRALLAALVILVVVAFDQRLQVTRYQLVDERLPVSFEGYRIAQISDLHCATFGEEQIQLIDAVNYFAPELILLTGDIMDRDAPSLEPVEQLLAGIRGIAPVYAINGNHELDNATLYAGLRELYTIYGVVELVDEGTDLYRGGESIFLYGLSFGRTQDLDLGWPMKDVPRLPEDRFGILLFHPDDHYRLAAERNWGFAYMFAGHSHGGIVRIPFMGGLLGNSGNFFPEYAGGVFQDYSMALVSSRGLGNTIRVPVPRIFNRPELVLVTCNGY